jgi:imidazole glycerol-phosphate synthase subunit HisF
MANIRLIARLDIKGPKLIKGIHLEGLRVVGDPQEAAREYYENGIDELIYIDAVASLYERNNLSDIVRYTAQNVFIPLTVGGGIRSCEDVMNLLRAGADKVAINTGAVRSPELISEAAQRFGSQCIVISIQAKQIGDGKWEAYTDAGREHSGLDVVEWAQRCEQLGAGEILLTSIDQEGTQKGFDIDLVRAVSTTVSIPVISSGGMGKIEDVEAVIKEGKSDSVAMAHVLHYKKLRLSEVRSRLLQSGVHIRSAF